MNGGGRGNVSGMEEGQQDGKIGMRVEWVTVLGYKVNIHVMGMVVSVEYNEVVRW
jgi:hypothetical protein